MITLIEILLIAAAGAILAILAVSIPAQLIGIMIERLAWECGLRPADHEQRRRILRRIRERRERREGREGR